MKIARGLDSFLLKPPGMKGEALLDKLRVCFSEEEETSAEEKILCLLVEYCCEEVERVSQNERFGMRALAVIFGVAAAM